MNTKLQTIIENIYKDYTPLQNLDRQLMGFQQKDSLKDLVIEKSVNLNDFEKKRINDELFGWGPISNLIEQDGIFDIIIQGPQTIFFEDKNGMHRHNDHFLSRKSFKNFIDLLSKEAKMLINQKDPFANGETRSFRVHMVIPPIVSETVVTLRKHHHHIFSLDNFLEQNFMNPKQLLFTKTLIENKNNFIIVGPTGSGKTTFLNSLINMVDDHERFVVIEDTDEIHVQKPLGCKLLAREICPDTLSPVSMEDLVKQSLRMRPDRIVIGEVRGQEAKDLLQALSTGHSGSMGTLHASTAKQALLRLEMLVQMGAPQWSLSSIRQLIQMSIQYIIVLSDNRQAKGIKEICQIRSHEKFGLLLETLNFRN